MTTTSHTKPGSAGLALTAAVLISALGVTACGAPAPGHADQLALTTLDNLAANNPAVTSSFSPAMGKTLPATDLAQDWKRYQDVLGNYQSHGQPQDLSQGDLILVNVPMNMARKPGQLRFTVDHDGHIAGVFFLDDTTPFEVKPAAESHPLTPSAAPQPTFLQPSPPAQPTTPHN